MQDGITSAFYEWAQASVSITISRKEERQNSGRSAALSLLQAKTTQSMNSLKEYMNNAIVAGRITTGASSATGQFSPRVGRLDSGALNVVPLSALIDANPTRSAVIGNINPNTYNWWGNQASNLTAVSTFAGYRNGLNHLYNNCARGVMGAPDLLLGTQVAYEQYWNGLANQERYIVTDQRVIDILGGSEALKFHGATFIWDEVVPDPGTNGSVWEGLGLSSGELQKDAVYMINTETMEWIYDAETNFITSPMVRPENQDARTGQILFMGIMGVNNRRKNGVAFNIQHTVFTS